VKLTRAICKIEIRGTVAVWSPQMIVEHYSCSLANYSSRTALLTWVSALSCGLASRQNCKRVGQQAKHKFHRETARVVANSPKITCSCMEKRSSPRNKMQMAHIAIPQCQRQPSVARGSRSPPTMLKRLHQKDREFWPAQKP